VTTPDEGQVRGLNDEQLRELQHIVTDELRGRAFDRVESERWTVGRLRSELTNLPEEMPLLVNVSVEMPGEDGAGFIPLVVTNGGFGVTAEIEPGEEQILASYSIETEPVDPTNGRLIWVIASA